MTKVKIFKLAEKVGKVLKQNDIDAVLVGGACVSIYSKNKYQSYDLDFVTESSIKEVEKALNEIGFKRKAGRLFSSDKSEFVIDLVMPPVSIGNESIREFSKIGQLQLLTATDCVKDRLSAFYYWNDMQSLDQAAAVARQQKKKIDFNEIECWSKEEGQQEKYKTFIENIK